MEDLDRDALVLLAVRCFIHHGHAAAAEFLVDLVVGCEELLDVGCQGISHALALGWLGGPAASRQARRT